MWLHFIISQEAPQIHDFCLYFPLDTFLLPFWLTAWQVAKLTAGQSFHWPQHYQKHLSAKQQISGSSRRYTFQSIFFWAEQQDHCLSIAPAKPNNLNGLRSWFKVYFQGQERGENANLLQLSVCSDRIQKAVSPLVDDDSHPSSGLQGGWHSGYTRCTGVLLQQAQGTNNAFLGSTFGFWNINLIASFNFVQAFISSSSTEEY